MKDKAFVRRVCGALVGMALLSGQSCVGTPAPVGGAPLVTGCGLFGGGCGGNTERLPGYGIQISVLLKRATLQLAVPPSPVPADASFGPEIGYPSPESAGLQPLGKLDRGNLVLIQSHNGDLSEMFISLDNAWLPADPDSAPTRLVVELPFDLAAGDHVITAWTPWGELVEQITFSLP